MWLLVHSFRLRVSSVKGSYFQNVPNCLPTTTSTACSREPSRHIHSRTRFHVQRAGGRYGLVLSIGLLAGGSIAAYLTVWKSDRTREEMGNDALSQVGAISTVSCHRREQRADERENMVNGRSLSASEKYGAAIEKSRDLLQRAKDEVGAPGIVAAVSIDGKLIWTEGIGYADVENRTPCSPSSVMRIASISKSLTMAAVAKLWEEGRLDLDKPVQEYVPSFPEKDWDGEKATLTTRHLVSHLGGIRHYNKSYMTKGKKEDEKENVKERSTAGDAKQNGVESKQAGKLDDIVKSGKRGDGSESRTAEKKFEVGFDEMKSKKEFKSVTKSLELFKSDPLMHKPGEKYVYTTHGWTLISAVVEAASGKDFLTYMQSILTELDLKHTVPDKHIPIIYNRARGYRYNKNGKLENTPYVDLSYKWAGGGYLSTVGDLVKFGNAMLYSYQFSPDHREQNCLPGYLKRETMQAIWKPIPDARAKPTHEMCYAMGWTAVDRGQKHGHCRPQRHIVAHSGGAMGFSSLLTIVPAPLKQSPDGCQTGDKRHDENTSQSHGNDSGVDSSSAVRVPPKGVVVAIIVNLLDVGLSRTCQGIAEAFQEAAAHAE